MAKWTWLGIILAAAGLLAGCVPGLPESAWQAAISAVCTSPVVDGQNTCQGIRFIGFADLTQEKRRFSIFKQTREYCVVLDYVDFTGEMGTAWVRVSGPDDSGIYQTDGEPLFNEACATVVQSP